MNGPAVDPRYATVAQRIRGLRVELNRLDDAVDLFERHDRIEMVRFTTRLRGELDGLEQLVERKAAGL